MKVFSDLGAAYEVLDEEGGWLWADGDKYVVCGDEGVVRDLFGDDAVNDPELIAPDVPSIPVPIHFKHG